MNRNSQGTPLPPFSRAKYSKQRLVSQSIPFIGLTGKVLQNNDLTAQIRLFRLDFQRSIPSHARGRQHRTAGSNPQFTEQPTWTHTRIVLSENESNHRFPKWPARQNPALAPDTEPAVHPSPPQKEKAANLAAHLLPRPFVCPNSWPGEQSDSVAKWRPCHGKFIIHHAPGARRLFFGNHPYYGIQISAPAPPSEGHNPAQRLVD